jgi:hypothetical protein
VAAPFEQARRQTLVDEIVVGDQHAQPPRGQIRGLVRSLKGTAVAAEIGIESENAADGAAAPEKEDLHADDGRFEIDVAPGRYRVTIAATGYQTQTREVDVEENGVTVLNVDLRAER